MDNLDKYMTDNASSNEDNSSTLLISLYLVVLAFFILLNSISENDNQKVKQAVDSLNSVFSSEKGMSQLIMATPEVFDFNFVINDYFDRIDGAIKSAFQLEEIKISRSGNRMEATIPINTFYDVNSSQIKRKQQKLLNKISKIIKSPANGEKLYFDFTIDSFSHVKNVNKESLEIDIKRASLIIDHLLSKGTPKELISGGIRFNNKQNITIQFVLLDGGSVSGVKSGGK